MIRGIPCHILFFVPFLFLSLFSHFFSHFVLSILMFIFFYFFRALDHEGSTIMHLLIQLVLTSISFT